MVMRGSQMDVLGFTLQRAAQDDFPKNKFIDPGLTTPWVDIPVMNLHKGQHLASQRTIPMMVHVKQQPVQVGVKGQNEQVLRAGSLAILPTHGGSLWKRGNK